MRIYPLLLCGSMTILASAQERLLMDTAQYKLYNSFMSRLRAEPVQAVAPATLGEYHLVWMLHDNGYIRTVASVDSVVTLQSMFPDRSTYPGGTLDDVTFHGEHFAVRVRDVPVSMLDITQWYFERKAR